MGYKSNSVCSRVQWQKGEMVPSDHRRTGQTGRQKKAWKNVLSRHMWKANITWAQVSCTMPPTSYIDYINCHNVHMLPASVSPFQANKLALQVAVGWEQLIKVIKKLCQRIKPSEINSHAKSTQWPAQQSSLWPNCDNMNNDKSNCKGIKTLNQQNPYIYNDAKSWGAAGAQNVQKPSS